MSTSYYSENAKNALLGGLTIGRLSLHTDNPGVDGTENEYSGGGYARVNQAFAIAADGVRKMSGHAVFTGEPDEAVSWVGYWTSATFRGAAELEGETSFDAVTGLLVLLADDTLYGIEECEEEAE